MRASHILPLFALTALSACGGTLNRGLESVHQPVVSRTDYVLDATAGVPAGDAEKINVWLQTLDVRYGDKIALDDPDNDPATRDAIAQILARYGLMLSPSAPVTEGELAPGTFRLVVSRHTAEVPECPDWSRPGQPEFEGSATSNYGCAYHATLAAMIADPQDLVRGRDSGGVNDAETAAKAIRTYRRSPSRDTGGIKIETAGEKK